MMMKVMIRAVAVMGLAMVSAPALADPVVEAVAPAPIDPARLAAAQVTVDHIFPLGTYARIMNGTLDKVIDGMMGNFGQMSLADLAAMGGADKAALAKLPKATLEDIMAIYDPAYHQRMTRLTHTMMDGLVDLMTKMEPGIRDGLAQAYATRYTLDQLNEMNRFFATPTGTLYAANALVIQMDPAVMAKMQAFLPQMMKAMPDLIKKSAAAAEGLPKPREWKDLSADEKARLAKLLGVSEADLAKGAAKSAH